MKTLTKTQLETSFNLLNATEDTKHELYHDGGDDLDYAGSYYAVLLDIITNIK